MTYGDIGGLAAGIALAGVVISIFWMYVGSRAMQAHERLAQAAEEMARKMREHEGQPA